MSKKKNKKSKKAPKEKRVSAEVLDGLVLAAKAARLNAYAPYSKYLVGAAIATKSGKIFTGANVENASYPAGICAERSAVAAMIAAGERDPIACAIVTRDQGPPCGMCRQVLVEFAREMPIVLVGVGKKGDDEEGRVVELADLLPLVFELQH